MENNKNNESLVKDWLNDGNKIKKLNENQKTKKKDFKPKQKPKSSNKRTTLKFFSKKINETPRPNQLWLINLYKGHNIQCETDLIFKPFKTVSIPFVVNHRYKYIIELVDETYKKNLLKTNNAGLYTKLGFKHFLIDEYNLKSYASVIVEIMRIRQDNKTRNYSRFIEFYLAEIENNK